MFTSSTAFVNGSWLPLDQGRTFEIAYGPNSRPIEVEHGTFSAVASTTITYWCGQCQAYFSLPCALHARPIYFQPAGQTGWICPRCGAGCAPSVQQCPCILNPFGVLPNP